MMLAPPKTERLIEKYRPRAWNEVVGQDDVVKAVQRIISRKDTIPHFMFLGPPGNGKTTVAHLIGMSLGCDVLEYNASDNRGIDFIRGDVKRLAEYASRRVVILDEADQLTPDAQFALRRTMEKSPATIFILIGNDETKFIDAIKSRCAIFRFRPLSDKDVRDKLLEIIRKEGYKLDIDTEEKKQRVRNAIMMLVDKANGDLRTAINDLEVIVDQDRSITPESVAVIRQPLNVMASVDMALTGRFDEARDLLETEYIEKGFDTRLVFKELYRSLMKVPKKSYRIRLFEKLGEVEYHIKHGADPMIQMTSFLAFAWKLPHLVKCPVLDK